jgi:hypothetical protein
MRRATRVGLVAVVGLLVLFGAYAAYWWVVAGQIRDGVAAWRQSEQSRKVDAAWRGLRVTGFPFAFHVEIKGASLRDRAWNPAPELRLARLTGTARPWDFADWRLSAPDGLSAELPSAGARPALKLTAKAAEGTASAGPRGVSRLWLGLHEIAGEAAGVVRAKSAEAWVALPEKPATRDTDPALGAAVVMQQVAIPEAPADFGKTIDELALGFTVRGVVPDGPLAQAAAAWRDAGGTIEIDNLRLQWGGLGVSANGTLALDRQLQPIAALSGGIEGFGVILNALVAADQMTPEQASLVEIALTTLARPGPDGKPQITAPFTIQNGKMYLGPAGLGAAPHIVWE